MCSLCSVIVRMRLVCKRLLFTSELFEFYNIRSLACRWSIACDPRKMSFQTRPLSGHSLYGENISHSYH